MRRRRTANGATTTTTRRRSSFRKRGLRCPACAAGSPRSGVKPSRSPGPLSSPMSWATTPTQGTRALVGGRPLAPLRCWKSRQRGSSKRFSTSPPTMREPPPQQRRRVRPRPRRQQRTRRTSRPSKAHCRAAPASRTWRSPTGSTGSATRGACKHARTPWRPAPARGSGGCNVSTRARFLWTTSERSARLRGAPTRDLPCISIPLTRSQQ
mmetsp:Transcript_60370/g.197552  ORF Transcript_60370/g.197552 Transcript_60370/m.197552 type:complete len:210 (+) Transcript_60370:1791-2420(+)